MAKDKEFGFEEALAKLETIVADMESGRLGLADSMKRFEEGMTLAGFCSAKLGEAEKKIEILLRNADGKPEWQEMSGQTSDGAPGQAPNADGDR